MAATVQDASAFLQGFDESAARSQSDLQLLACTGDEGSTTGGCARQSTMDATLDDASFFLHGFDHNADRRHSFDDQPMTPPSSGPVDAVDATAQRWHSETTPEFTWDVTTRMQQAHREDAPARNLRSSPPRSFATRYLY